MKNTSWQKSARWYNKIVGNDGHYYHQKTVLPGALKLLNLKTGDSLVDLACGQGVLERQLPKGIRYLGIDLADNLIREAEKNKKEAAHKFIVKDISKPIMVTDKFNKAAIILALQNLRNPKGAVENAYRLLNDKGILILVINHPVFRIPRHSSWEVDKTKKMQYRRIDSYLTPMEIPIDTNPGRRSSKKTWTYHYPLSAICQMLTETGFLIFEIEEWVSDKTSEGGAAKMENRARAEFPLFMAIGAVKG